MPQGSENIDTFSRVGYKRDAAIQIHAKQIPKYKASFKAYMMIRKIATLTLVPKVRGEMCAKHRQLSQVALHQIL